MRKLSVVMMVAILFATVGIYAASVTGSAKTLGGTGDVSIAAPASTAAVSWTVDSAGDVTGATVDWTPANAGDYTLKAQVNASTGTFSCTVCGTGGRSDAITLSAPVASDLVTTSNVAIIED